MNREGNRAEPGMDCLAKIHPGASWSVGNSARTLPTSALPVRLPSRQPNDKVNVKNYLTPKHEVLKSTPLKKFLTPTPKQTPAEPARIVVANRQD